MPVPDLVFCTSKLTLNKSKTSDLFSFKRFYLAGNADVPKGMRINTPCGGGDYGSMWVLWTANGTWNTYETVEMARVRFDPEGTSLWYQLRVARQIILTISTPYYLHPNEPQDNAFFSLFLIPHELNPYRVETFIPSNSTRRDPRFRTNYHYGVQNQTNLHAFVRPERTRVLRNDFWGYFNQYNDSATEYMLTSSLDYNFSPGETWMGLYPPTMMVENKQVLIMSFMDALASWGGAFSIVFGLFFVLFGVRPLSPFGLIQKYLMRDSTKANISKIYGNWKKDRDGYYREDRGGGGGNRDSRMSISSSHTSLSGLDSVGTDNRRSFQNFHIDQSSREPLLAGGSAPNRDFPEVNETHPHFLVDEVLALRKEMKAQAKVLKHLQKHEQRFMDIETLLKEFYLDMDLVDTKTVDPDTVALLSPPTENLYSSEANTPPPIGWTQRLFRTMTTSGRPTAVNNDPESDTVGLSASAQGIAGYDQTQWNVPPLSFSKVTGGYTEVPSDAMRLQQLARED
ncbi:hypothetical protein BGX26_008516 [Mortierella sp. AD094]|nr:hypothetical protein BGX26_008516 [Mortierella sp. AD094]